MATFFEKLQRQSKRAKSDPYNRSLLRRLVTGSFYKVSDLRGDSDLADIKTQIDTMRALARDSQISTALSYYATDATVANANGDIIWATAIDPKYAEIEEIINSKFKQWNVAAYARDHILELATIGNLYIPTSACYRDAVGSSKTMIALDHNSVPDLDFDIIPAYKIPPENIVHLWHMGKPVGYIMQPSDQSTNTINYDDDAIIHFTLGGLLGQYTIAGYNSNNEEVDYDIQFGTPLMAAATQPTQVLSLLEDALVLSSLTRIVRFINVDCGNAEEEEIQATLQQIKDMIEQQLSINTSTGDAQSFVNPQSPNNLIYLPKINNQDAISITDMNMSEATDADNKLLDYYQDKKLSVLGVPKEAMNFSSAEGLGGAGAVMSQRSALYANSLQRLETAYIAGWRDAINKYLVNHNLSGYVDKFELHMNPIITQMSTINFDRRDAALGQASTVTDILKALGIEDSKEYRTALTEILSEVLPKTGASVNSWNMDLQAGGEPGEF